MENSLKGLMLAAGVIITCIVVGLGFFISREARDTASNGAGQISKLNAEFNESDKVMYDGLEVSGSEVINVINKYKNEEVGVMVYTKKSNESYIYKIDYKDDESILDDWALHIRRNYIEDTELKEDADDNAMTVEQYLHDYVIPQKGEELGATVRSADITEILISDLLEFVHQYSVPRYKLKNRSGKNNSQQGTDVIAYKYKNEDKTPNDKDELVAAEVKATLSNTEYIPIKNAIIDSRKDEHRLARSVNYCRKRLKELGKIEEAEEVKRFLFKPDNNYRITYVAAGVSSRENVDDAIELDFSGEELEIRKNELIFYVHGKKLMELAHNIYQRCCK